LKGGLAFFIERRKGMKRFLTLSITTFISIFLIGTTLVTAGDVGLTDDGKVPGKPFVELQNQIDELRERLDSIQVNAGLEVHDGSGLFLGYLVQKNRLEYVVFNPEVEAFFLVVRSYKSNPYSKPYRLCSTGYLSNDCTGEAYINGNAENQELFGCDRSNYNTIYMVDNTKLPIPESDELSHYSYEDERVPPGWYSVEYTGDPQQLAFPLKQVDNFPIANMELQYPIIIKAAE
jgi:hypothetical protein